MEVSGQLHTLTTLPLGRSPRYPLNRRLAGPQSSPGCGDEEKSLSCPYQESNSGHSFCSLVIVLMELLKY